MVKSTRRTKRFYARARDEHPQGWRPRTNKFKVVCPFCDNDDAEKLCEIRHRFFKCEACKEHFDADMSQ